MRAVVVVVSLIALSAVAPAVSGTLVTASSTESLSGPAWQPSLQEAPGNNSTNGPAVTTAEPMVNPRGLSSGASGDRDAIERWLTSKMAARLEGSAIRLNESRYGEARGALGERYESYLSRYVTLVDGNETRRERAETLRRAGEEQREYVGLAERYQRTLEDYREARAAGNETAARQYARELSRLATRLNETGTNLTRTLTRLSEQTDADVSGALEVVRSTQANVSETADVVREQEFVATRLSVEQTSVTATFTEPAVLSGRLLDEEGEPLANRTVAFVLAGERAQTRTGPDGRFTLMYRPTTVRLNSSDASVRFRPNNDSVYQSAVVPVSVELNQSEPRLALTEVESPLAAGDRFVVVGVVGVDGTPAAGVPVEIQAGGRRLGTDRTNENGTFRLDTPLPVSVPSGTIQVEAAYTQTGTALAPAATRRQIRVDETPTAVVVTDVRHDPTTQRIEIEGRLIDRTRTGIEEQTISLSAGGTDIGRTVTTENGTFNTAFTVPASQRPVPGVRATLPLSVEFTGTNTSLGSSSTTTRVGVTQSLSSPAAVFGYLEFLVAGLPATVLTQSSAWAVLVLIPLLFGDAVLWVRQRDTTQTEPPSTAESTAAPDSAAERTSAPSSTGDITLGTARDRLADGEPVAATEAAYLIARRELSNRFGFDPGRTHRQFRAACIEHLPSETRTALDRLVETYEQTVFARPPTPDDAVSDAITDAETLVDVATAFDTEQTADASSRDASAQRTDGSGEET